MEQKIPLRSAPGSDDGHGQGSGAEKSNFPRQNMMSTEHQEGVHYRDPGSDSKNQALLLGESSEFLS